LVRKEEKEIERDRKIKRLPTGMSSLFIFDDGLLAYHSGLFW